MSDILEGLNSAQLEAVRHVEGPLLILAGPGSGKTRVVTHRVGWLVRQGIPGHEILALTFTNKAADEMKNRIERLTGGRSVWVGTYHRFAARMLRKYAPLAGIEENYTIYDTDDSLRAMKRAIRESRTELLQFTPKQVAAAVSWAKNGLIGPADYQGRPGHPLGAVVARVYPAYQALLTKSNAVDFDDLLGHLARILRENPEVRGSLDRRFRFILVDEYQDTNLAQYAIARAMSIDYPNLAVTGDPDQSIYGWRGANLRNILDFEKDYPDVRIVRLEENYRSTRRILRIASQLIAHNVKRKKKDLFTENEAGAPVALTTYADQKEEARRIVARIADQIDSGRRSARDFAIFYRVNALSRAFELALREAGVPFQLVRGLEFFQRREIKDVLGYLQLLNNPRDDVALLRVINTPARGIGQTTLQRLADHATRSGLTLLEAAGECGRVKTLNKRAQGLVRKFVALFERLLSVVDSPVEEILGHVLTESGYAKTFEDSDNEEDRQRLANIEELLTVARDFDERDVEGRRLEAFLEETSLTNDTDDWETDNDRVTLMTLHASKGLEFPVVFLVALEQGLLPHDRSKDSPDQLEEERRLMFVGVTRARQELRISLASYRDFRGKREMPVPSQFLMELPRGEMDVTTPGVTTSFVDEEFPDDDFSEVEFPEFEADPAPASRATSSGAVSSPTGSGRSLLLQTAAELASGVASVPSVDPDDFHQGIVVRHPKHGLGRVVALSGSGAGRRATVDFASKVGRLKFVISQSPLHPVKRPDSGKK